MKIKTPFILGLLTLVTVMYCTPLLYATNVTLAWERPEVDVNGTPLTDLAGFYVYTGFSSRNYHILEDIGNVTNHTVENVPEGEPLYLAVTAYDTSGNESDYSEEIIISVAYCDDYPDSIDCDDNCVNTPNADQADEDSDGAGDVCDSCPNISPDEPPIISDVSVNGCLSELCQSDLLATGIDPCNGNLMYTWTPLNGGQIIGSGASVQFDPPDSGPHPCPYQVELRITSDASNLESTQIVPIHIKIAGDADGSGVVNLMDKLLVRQHFGELSDSPNWDDRADVNCDGVVNLLDKLKVREQFGQIDGCECQ